MTWKISDGTVVRLGGEVEGGSLLAQELREDIANGVLMSFDPPPGGVTFKLDVNNVLHMDFWLRRELARSYWRAEKLTIVEAPSNVPDAPNRTDGQHPGTVY